MPLNRLDGVILSLPTCPQIVRVFADLLFDLSNELYPKSIYTCE